MNQVLVQICFLVSGVAAGCVHVPVEDAPAYNTHQQAQYILVQQGPAFNLTAQPNWQNVKRNTQPRHNYVPYVVQQPQKVFRSKNNRRWPTRRRLVVRRHY